MVQSNNPLTETPLVVYDDAPDDASFSSEVANAMTAEDFQINRIEYGGYSLNGYTASTGYRNSLSRLQPNKAFNFEDEDGYESMRGRKRSWLDRTIKFPFRALRRIAEGPKVTEPGALILVRHGESQWNANKTFTGWSDPDLSADGVREVEHAARLLLEGGWEIDLVFTSRLKRAIRSAWIILQVGPISACLPKSKGQ
jgi:Histidine phosphatase superfamily (branch 1)